jgi:hypothetical protein
MTETAGWAAGLLAAEKGQLRRALGAVAFGICVPLEAPTAAPAWEKVPLARVGCPATCVGTAAYWRGLGQGRGRAGGCPEVEGRRGLMMLSSRVAAGGCLPQEAGAPAPAGAGTLLVMTSDHGVVAMTSRGWERPAGCAVAVKMKSSVLRGPRGQGLPARQNRQCKQQCPPCIPGCQLRYQAGSLAHRHCLTLLL